MGKYQGGGANFCAQLYIFHKNNGLTSCFRVAGKQPSIWGYKGFDYVHRSLGKLHHYKNSGRCAPYNVTDKATSRYQYKLIAAMTPLWNKLFGAG